MTWLHRRCSISAIHTKFSPLHTACKKQVTYSPRCSLEQWSWGSTPVLGAFCGQRS